MATKVATRLATKSRDKKMVRKEVSTDTQVKRAIREVVQADKTVSYPVAGYKGLEIRIRPHKEGADATADFRHRYTHPITGKRPYIVVEVKAAEAVILTDENGNDIIYEHQGEEYLAAQIDYTLGKILEKHID